MKYWEDMNEEELEELTKKQKNLKQVFLMVYMLFLRKKESRESMFLR
jgi:hypothetical protein